jgi:predicted signal transduction protein with EAL and GGDEF domain
MKLETVPCELCNAPTLMCGTRRCDICWELERRIEARPEVAAAILARLQRPAEGVKS